MKRLHRILLTFMCLMILSAIANGIGSESLVEVTSFYGEWVVVRCLALPFVSEFNEERIAAYIGDKFLYEQDLACSESVCIQPFYKFIQVKVEELGQYRIKVDDLELSTETIIEVKLSLDKDFKRLWQYLGNVIYIKDDDTLILYDGAFFEMKRVNEQTGSSLSD